jgi:hypothetical protein
MRITNFISNSFTQFDVNPTKNQVFDYQLYRFQKTEKCKPYVNHD